MACYSESSTVGFYNHSSSGATFVGCYSEDVIPANFGTSRSLVVGGTLSAAANAPYSVGLLSSHLDFAAQTSEGVRYVAGTGSVTVSLVWHFEAFVTNYAGAW